MARRPDTGDHQGAIGGVLRDVLKINLLCSRRERSNGIYTIELTALQFSDFRVSPWSRC